MVASTKQSILNGGDRKEMMEKQKNKQKSEAKKMMQKAAEEERNALFGEALLAVAKKTSTKLKSSEAAVGRDGGDAEKKAKPGQVSKASDKI